MIASAASQTFSEGKGVETGDNVKTRHTPAVLSQTFSEGKGVETALGCRFAGRRRRCRRPSQKVKVLKHLVVGADIHLDQPSQTFPEGKGVETQ